MSEEGRFLCDEMLGKLARELRALGYDAAYARDVGDDAILQRARDEDRLLLTRDVQLAQQAGMRALLLQTRDPSAQLGTVIEARELAPTAQAFLSRCLECNEPLVQAQASEEVPADVEGEPHWRCPSCQRLYWPGTHARDMLDRLREHLPADADPDEALDTMSG